MEKKRIRDYQKEKTAQKIYAFKNKEKIAALKREWRKRNPEKVKEQKRISYHKNKHRTDRIERDKRSRLKKRYGITLEFFNEQVSKNNNKCGCCFKEFTGNLEPYVDHCHKTGSFRGIICVRCNIVEGYLRENPDIFGQLQEYLKEKSNELPKSSL